MVKRFTSFIFAIVTAVGVASCATIAGGSQDPPTPLIASALSDMDGNARVESAAGVMEFTTISGETGLAVTGIRVSVAVVGGERLIYAEDPSGAHFPVAVPLRGGSTVRRLVMPPVHANGYNITTAAGVVDPIALESEGVLDEASLRARLGSLGDEAVLIYRYNPAQPLALTGAALEVFSTPFDNVLVLRPPIEDEALETGLLLVGLHRDAYDSWAHILVDRYLAGRIGQPPITDLNADLNFGWAYPVFQIFPAEPDIALGPEGELTLLISWRSRNPDPPPPWSFFVSTDNEARLRIEPQNFSLAPDDAPREVTIAVDRSGLAPGEYTATVYVQPFSEAFGLIEQTVERTVTFSVGEQQPTPTPGPSADISTLPTEPREGNMLEITASGFSPGEAVLVEFVGEDRTIRDGLPVADADGNFAYNLDLSTVPEGGYVLTLTGTVSGLVGTTEVLVRPGIADAVVNTRELNVRTGPDYAYPVLEIVAQGDELDVVGTNDDDSWLEIVTPTGVQGWVVSDLLDISIDLSTVPWNPNVPAPP